MARERGWRIYFPDGTAFRGLSLLTAPLACRLQLRPMYSAQLLDHFQNPRNAGEIADADAAAEIENPACGDVFRLT